MNEKDQAMLCKLDELIKNSLEEKERLKKRVEIARDNLEKCEEYIRVLESFRLEILFKM